MSILDAVGSTRLVELERLASGGRVRLLAKLEGDNPAGSVKDRAALAMVRGAMERGELRQGDTLVEATSGNTGIALAMVASRLGLRLELIMPDDATQERVRLMRAYGAEVVLTPAARTIEYSREVAHGRVGERGYVLLDQFSNPDNVGAHERTTGPELWEGTAGEITHFVSAMGTTGTIMGVSRYLKARDPQVQIIGTQPTQGSQIPGIRRWSPEFVPAIYQPERVDRLIDVSSSDAKAAARRLAREEGILAGMSAGGALAAALQVVEELRTEDRLGTVVFIVPDRGERYLSGDLFG